ncbi:DNA polymerase III, partial [candidate division KSB1 bacterium]|nr:DNA polymerase III [candidate division KSB1 bacterium]
MPVHNSDIVKIFNKVADLLDIKDENQFRIRAYRNAARTISGLSKNVADMVEQDEDLTQFSGIGDDLAGKIEEVVETGTLKQLEDLEEEVPIELSEMMRIADLGPRRVKKIHDELGITTVDELEQAAEKDEIRELEGFGEKTQQKIVEEIGRRKQGGQDERFKLRYAEEISLPLLNYLKIADGVKEAVIAGSYRRCKETVGDIDILVTVKRGTDIMDRFVDYEDVARVISKGKTRSTVMLRDNFQVDLRVVQEVSYGAALLYFTGSKAHNVKVRKMANARDLKINEYGVFSGDD